jgi:hypothetical protein
VLTIFVPNPIRKQLPLRGQRLDRGVRAVLDEHHLGHQRIKPHCPEENGIIERSNRTLREALDGAELTDLYQAGT